MQLTNQFFWILNKFANEEIRGVNCHRDDPSGDNEERVHAINYREFKHDVYSRRQTAKITSDFLFFSCNP